MMYPHFDLLEISNELLVELAKLSKLLIDISSEKTTDSYLKYISNLNLYIDYLQKLGIYKSYFSGEEQHQEKTKNVFSRVENMTKEVLDISSKMGIDTVSQNVEKVKSMINKIISTLDEEQKNKVNE